MPTSSLSNSRSKVKVKLLEKGKGPVYALELFSKTILPCNPLPDSNEAEIELSLEQAANIIMKQKKCMPNFKKRLAELNLEHPAFEHDLYAMFGGNVIWVRLSREPGVNMFVCLVGLVLQSETPNEHTLEVNLPSEVVHVYDLPGKSHAGPHDLKVGCVANWNGGRYEKIAKEHCPVSFLEIMNARGTPSGRNDCWWHGIWQMGAITCAHIDREEWPKLDVECKMP